MSEADDKPFWNMLFSDGVVQDNLLSREGYTFLGAGKHNGKETHVFLNKDCKLSQQPKRPLQYIVMVDNTNEPMSFKDRYRVYNDFDEALSWASANGYDNPLGTNKEVGMLNICKYGDIDISIMAVEAIG